MNYNWIIGIMGLEVRERWLNPPTLKVEDRNKDYSIFSKVEMAVSKIREDEDFESGKRNEEGT